MKISLIVAASENNVIGINHALPWHLPTDMEYFKEKTLGHHILTGRKNYESIPAKFRPLTNRKNLIVTRDKNHTADGAFVFQTIASAISFATANDETELFIIGGGEIFNQTISFAHKIYLTRVHAIVSGTVFFPALNEKEEWQLTSAERIPKDEKNKFDFSFLIFEKF